MYNVKQNAYAYFFLFNLKNNFFLYLSQVTLVLPKWKHFLLYRVVVWFLLLFIQNNLRCEEA